MKLSLFKKEIVLVKTVIQDGITFQIFLDDYGQSYLLVWEDPITHKEESWCCGTYNDYQNDLEDIAKYINERRKTETNG